MFHFSLLKSNFKMLIFSWGLNMLNQTKTDEIVANKKRRFLFLMGLVLAFSSSLYLLTLMKQSSFALHSDVLSHEKSVIFQIGPEVLVSNNLDGGALRCEPSAVISSDAIVIAWNDSYGGIHGAEAGVAIGWAISKNGGKTYQFGGYLSKEQKDYPPDGADSWLMADGEGNFYLQLLRWHKEINEIQIYYMDHNHLGKWKRMTDAQVSDSSKGDPSLDKPAMFVDDSGRIGIIYTEMYRGQGNSISFLLSNDKGRSWSKPLQISPPEEKVKTGASISISGSLIVVAWIEGGAMNLDEVWYAISQDGGISFSAPNMVYKLKESLKPPSGYSLGVGPAAFISNNVWLACRKNEKGHSTFYLTCVEGAEKGSRILLFTLKSGEKTWSKPIRVGNSPDKAVKVFPSLAMAGSRPAILYYDRRNNPHTSLTDVYLSVLVEELYFRDAKINTVSTDWTKAPGDKKYAPIQRNFGDYITLASHDHLFVATWTDARSGASRIYARTIQVH